MPDQKPVPLSGSGVLARVYWMFFGPTILFFSIIFILQKGQRFPSVFDAVYWIALVSLLLVRYVDIRFLNGETGEGQPATMAHWRRYALTIGVALAGVWLVVRGLAALLK